MPRRRFPTDLTDAQWAILEPLIPAVKPGGRPAIHPRREIVDALLYVLRGGISWRALPHEHPPWQTVYDYFRRWRDDGTWAHVNTVLRERLRIKLGRDPQPSAAIIDSQSLRTSEKRGVRGYDGGKNISGRKRPILVDTHGLLLKGVVQAADHSDRNAVHLPLAGVAEDRPRLGHLWVDAGYTGKGVAWIEETLKWSVEVVKRPRRWVWWPADSEPPPLLAGFQVLPRRWVVERTFAWLGRYRRLSKDDEVLPATTEAWMYLAMSNLMTARLAKYPLSRHPLSIPCQILERSIVAPRYEWTQRTVNYPRVQCRTCHGNAEPRGGEERILISVHTNAEVIPCAGHILLRVRTTIAAALITVLHVGRRAVVPGSDDSVVEDEHRPDPTAQAIGSLADSESNVHVVGISAEALGCWRG